MSFKLLQMQLSAVINLRLTEVQKGKREAESYSRADRAEGHHPLDVVSIAATPWFPVRVLSPLQHKLLSTETGVLVSDPAVHNKQMDTKTHKWEVMRRWSEHWESSERSSAASYSSDQSQNMMDSYNKRHSFESYFAAPAQER